MLTDAYKFTAEIGFGAEPSESWRRQKADRNIILTMGCSRRAGLPGHPCGALDRPITTHIWSDNWMGCVNGHLHCT